MNKPTTIDDILPLVAQLSPQERARLIRLNVELQTKDCLDIYRIMPPHEDEFGSDEEPLAWEAEGWEEFYPPDDA